MGNLCNGVNPENFPVSAGNDSLAHSVYIAEMARKRVNERKKMEIYHVWYLGSEKLRKSLLPSMSSPKQDMQSKPWIHLPHSTHNTHTHNSGSYLENKDGKNSTGKKKEASVSWILKIFIWSLRFMIGPGILAGSAHLQTDLWDSFQFSTGTHNGSANPVLQPTKSPRDVCC